MQLPQAIISVIESPQVLFSTTGSQEAVEVQLQAAKALQGARVRVATWNSNRHLVLQSGFEFYDIGTGHLGPGHSRRELDFNRRSVSLRLFSAEFDEGHAQTRNTPARPFIADIIFIDKSLMAQIHDNRRMRASIVLPMPEYNSTKDLEAHFGGREVLEQAKPRESAAHCAIFPALTSRWRHGPSRMDLSGAAAAGLVSSGKVRWSELDILPRTRQRIHSADISRSLACLCSYVRPMNVLILFVTRLVSDLYCSRMEGQFARENRKCLEMREPARCSRVKQAYCDLQSLKERVDGDVEDFITRRWETGRVKLLTCRLIKPHASDQR